MTRELEAYYDRLDKFLRDNLDDHDYAEYSEALEALWAAQPAAEPVDSLLGKLVGAAMDLEREQGANAGMDESSSAWQLVKSLERRVLKAANAAQPAAECKAGGACRWRGNASAEFLAEHEAQQQEPLTTDEQIDVMWRRAGIANNARGAFFAGARATLAQQQDPVAHIVVIKTDAGPTKFFTAPSDQRGFPVYTHPPQDAKDAARYRDDLISCRGMVKTELNHYERLALVHGKTAVAENYEKEAQRLSDLLDRIDAAIKETPC